MSGLLFNLPNARQLSIAGAIMPGFKLKFFLSGTLTPAAVYADGDLNTSLGVEVEAEGDGHMVPIYLNPAVLYRVQIYDSNDVLQPDGDVDPVNIEAAELGLITAADVSYDNNASGLASTDVQDAIDELVGLVDAASGDSEFPDFRIDFSVSPGSTSIQPSVNGLTGPTHDGSAANFSPDSPPADMRGALNRNTYTTASANDLNCGPYLVGTFSGVFRELSAVANGAGFRFKMQFSWDTVGAAQRAWAGLFGSVTPFSNTVDPSAAVNTLFFAKDAADTNLQVMHNDASGVATKVDTGVAFNTLTGKLLQVRISVTPGNPNPLLELYNLESGAPVLVYSHTPSSNLPATNQRLWWQARANTAGDATPVVVGYYGSSFFTRFGTFGA